MNIEELISRIRLVLSDTFSEIDQWFLKDSHLREYKPKDGGWSINQILEHIGLTNHFLLILINKGAKKALANTKSLELANELKNYIFHEEKLNEIGIHKSFSWIRPEHMEPRGEKNLEEVREQLISQLHQCFETLDRLPNGEGVLSKTTMTVNGLGKINVYEYIYFLAKHGQRHLTQMKKVEAEYQKAYA
jgi:hypothetical protein